MKILTFEQLPQAGFAGLIERQFVTDRRVFGPTNSPAFNGLDNFVYLADANFLPYGETRMHGHREVDVISVMVTGEIEHQGSLAHGGSIAAGKVQVQRAGGEGFKHNEVNPNNAQNHMIQLWVLPDEKGQAADYGIFHPKQGELTQVYGGNKTPENGFDNQITIAVADMTLSQRINLSGEIMVYLSQGTAKINGETINARTLIHSKSGITFNALSLGQAIFIYRTNEV